MGLEQPFTRRDSPKKKIKLWIDAIPDSRLAGAFAEKQTIKEDNFFRLDCQGVTTSTPHRFNLQVQVNFEVPDSSLAMLAPATVAWALVPAEYMWTPQEIKSALKSTVTGWNIPRPGPEGIITELPKKGKGMKKK